jgi:hypothetical protein
MAAIGHILREVMEFGNVFFHSDACLTTEGIKKRQKAQDRHSISVPFMVIY